VKNFKIRLRFTHTPGNYLDILEVFNLHDLSSSIGTCTVRLENNEIVGYMDLTTDVSDDLFVYYRYNTEEGLYTAIQFLEEPRREMEALTIRELLR
jgi:hypothetical protein